MLAYFCCLEDGGQCVSDIIAQGIIPAAMEMIDAMTLNCVEDCHKLGLKRDAGALLVVELDGPKSAIALEKAAVEQCAFNNKCLDIHWAADAQERMLIWKARKSAFGALGRLAPHGYVLDGVIPRSKLREAIAEIHSIGLKHDLPIANVYHAGDGNLHPCLLYNRDNEAEVRRVLLAGREILELCVNLGGTLSGEHGIGVEKLLEMKAAFCPSDLASMLSVREAFDPRLLFNPGKLIPTTKSCGESGARPLLRHQIGSC